MRANLNHVLQHLRKVADTQTARDLTDGELLERFRSTHEETAFGRLPDKYRVPVVLCYLEGKSHEQAARELAWPKSSVSARLGRARQLLQARLTRRGLAPSAGLLAVALTEEASAAVPALLTLSAVRLAVTGPVAAVSLPAVALAESVVKGMTAAKLLLVAGLLLGVSLVLASVATLARPY